MSVALYITPETEIEGFDCHVDGKAIAQVSDVVLQRLFDLLDVPSLWDYISQDSDELEDFLDELEEFIDHVAMDEGLDEEPMEQSQEQWFPASAGLASVEPLLQLLRGKPESLRNAPAVIQDLEEYHRVLTRLAQDNIRFHFSLDF